MRYCPVCKCRGTVNIPPENVASMERNKGKMDNYKKLKNEWDCKKESGEVCARVGARGKTCGERAPKMPQLERLPYICHCHQMRNPNPQNPNAAGSTCVLKCCDPNTGKWYGFDEQTRKQNVLLVCATVQLHLK